MTTDFRWETGPIEDQLIGSDAPRKLWGEGEEETIAPASETPDSAQQNRTRKIQAQKTRTRDTITFKLYFILLLCVYILILILPYTERICCFVFRYRDKIVELALRYEIKLAMILLDVEKS